MQPIEFKDGGTFQFGPSKFDLYPNNFEYEWAMTRKLPRKKKKQNRKRLIDEDIKRFIKNAFYQLYVNHATDN